MRKGRGEQMRAAPFWWGVLALLGGLGLTSVPLFNLWGYELGLAMAPLAAAAALQLGLREVGRQRAGASFAAREAADLRSLRAILALYAGTLLRTLPALLAPLAVLGANALRVRNCNPVIGLGWYAVLPVASAAFSAALGVFLGVLAPPLTKPLRAVGVAIVALLLAAGWCLARLYAAPPIFVFDPIFGYFAGSLYDEHVAVPGALYYARLYHAAIACALLCAAGHGLDGHTWAASFRAMRGRRASALLFVLSLGAALTMYRLGPRLGYRHDAASIAAALGGERHTTHFVLHYREGGPYGREIDEVARELEFCFDELSRLTGLSPAGTVHAYLFASAAEKQSLMGAGRTYIAKPWRHEIYVNHGPFPQAVLAHELAHVFGASVGDPLLGVARDGLHLDVGLIEGYAEALTWHGAALTPDETARALGLLGRLPELDQVMSSQFWSLPSQQAYAVAGSFVHFLLERGGKERLNALYRRGGARAAYLELYGASFDALAASWRTALAQVELPTEALERERDRILRPSIFRRPCARELARRLELAHALIGRGELDGARKLYEQVCADEPDDPGHLDELLGVTARSGHVEEAEGIAARLLAHKKTSATQRGAAYSTLGDLRSLAGDHAAAAALYARAEAEPTEEAAARMYTVKRVLCARLAVLAADARGRDAPTRATTQAVLTALTRPAADPLEDFLRITAAARRVPEDGLLAYLAARQLMQRALFVEAAAALASASALPDERFAREADRLRAELAFRTRDFPTAIRLYTELGTRGSAAARLDATLFARRAAFFATHGGSR